MTDQVNPLFENKLYDPPTYRAYVHHSVANVCLNVFSTWPIDKENTINLEFKMFFVRFGVTSIHK